MQAKTGIKVPPLISADEQPNATANATSTIAKRDDRNYNVSNPDTDIFMSIYKKNRHVKDIS